MDPFGRGGGVCGQNVCYHVAAFRDSHLFDMQNDIVNFDLWTLSEEGEGSAGKTFATMLLHS